LGIETTLTLLVAAALFCLVGLMYLSFRSGVWIYRRFRPVPESQRAHPDTREWPQRAPLGERIGRVASRIVGGLATGLQFVAAYLAAWFGAAGRGARTIALASGRTSNSDHVQRGISSLDLRLSRDTTEFDRHR
jgi:hypothetical protein